MGIGNCMRRTVSTRRMPIRSARCRAPAPSPPRDPMLRWRPRDPRPFVNMAHAITRRNPGGKATELRSRSHRRRSDRRVHHQWRPQLASTRMPGRWTWASLLTSSSSTRDIVRMAAGRAAPTRIAKTRVMQTWFRGRQGLCKARHYNGTCSSLAALRLQHQPVHHGRPPTTPSPP